MLALSLFLLLIWWKNQRKARFYIKKTSQAAIPSVCRGISSPEASVRCSVFTNLPLKQYTFLFSNSPALFRFRISQEETVETL